jgi:hypothetical protein
VKVMGAGYSPVKCQKCHAASGINNKDVFTRKCVFDYMSGLEVVCKLVFACKLLM